MSADGQLWYVIGVDIDPQYEADFDEWYDTDHLPTVVACPGFISGRRFVSDDPDQSPRFLAAYEVESPETLRTPELREIAGFAQFADKVKNIRQLWFRSHGPVITHD